MQSVILELPFPCERAAKRALLRGAARRIARMLREELNYPGAALALEMHVETLRDEPFAEDDEPTVVLDVVEC